MEDSFILSLYACPFMTSPIANLVGFFLGGCPDPELLSSSFCEQSNRLSFALNISLTHILRDEADGAMYKRSNHNLGRSVTFALRVLVM